jgi:hypothetical protein
MQQSCWCAVSLKKSCNSQLCSFALIVAGDFWHLRGALRVDVLNAVMAQLAQWTVPVVLLPGNHDQVDR